MPFVFLGLLNDEQRACSKRNSATERARDGGLKLSDEFRKEEETTTPRSASGVFPPVQAENVTKSSDDSPGQVSALSPQLEELRRKLAGKEPQPQVSRVVSDGIPTFGTFKFGYLPGRGLLYSAIAHEVALFGLFLLF